MKKTNYIAPEIEKVSTPAENILGVEYTTNFGGDVDGDSKSDEKNIEYDDNPGDAGGGQAHEWGVVDFGLWETDSIYNKKPNLFEE